MNMDGRRPFKCQDRLLFCSGNRLPREDFDVHRVWRAFGCCMTMLLRQGEYPQAGAVSLFRVVFGAEHTIEEFDGVRPDALGAAHKIGLAPFADKTVGGRHVFLLSGISMRFGTVGVYRNSFVLVKNLDVPSVIQDLDLAANISVRDAFFAPSVRAVVSK